MRPLTTTIRDCIAIHMQAEAAAELETWKAIEGHPYFFIYNLVQCLNVALGAAQPMARLFLEGRKAAKHGRLLLQIGDGVHILKLRWSYTSVEGGSWIVPCDFPTSRSRLFGAIVDWIEECAANEDFASPSPSTLSDNKQEVGARVGFVNMIEIN